MSFSRKVDSWAVDVLSVLNVDSVELSCPLAAPLVSLCCLTPTPLLINSTSSSTVCSEGESSFPRPAFQHVRLAGADLCWEKSTVGCLLVTDLFWEKSTAGWWLISQANRLTGATIPSSMTLAHEPLSTDDSREECKTSYPWSFNLVVGTNSRNDNVVCCLHLKR
jgi:hypothetical protein